MPSRKKTSDNETFVMIIIRILYKVIHFMNVCKLKFYRKVQNKSYIYIYIYSIGKCIHYKNVI